MADGISIDDVSWDYVINGAMCYPIVFVPIRKENKTFPEKVPVTDLHRQILDTPVPMLFIFTQSSGKFGKIIG